MNCREIEILMMEGRTFDAQAAEHLAGCTDCRSLADALTSPVSDSPINLESLKTRLASDWRPVRPLPSDLALFSRIFIAFVIFVVVVAILAGAHALRALNTTQMVVYYGGLVAVAACFSLAMTALIIPGARRRVSSAALVLSSLAILVGLSLTLFGNADSADFVSRGVRCLSFGCLFALAAGMSGWFLFRRGFVTAPAEAMAVFGAFAGLAGFSVLALHCAVMNSAHVLIWHVGTQLLALLAGAALGRSLETRTGYEAFR